MKKKETRIRDTRIKKKKVPYCDYCLFSLVRMGLNSPATKVAGETRTKAPQSHNTK